MSTGVKIAIGIGAAFLLIFVAIPVFFVWGSYNSLVTQEENVNQAWSQVENVYQRRADLIPNLVNTVKGYAAHEKTTLDAVVQARASATQMKVDAEKLLSNPKMFQQFEQVQGELTSALSRLLLVVENYPNLKANENFLHLQDELAGTENRISVERRRYNLAAQGFNTSIRRFPRNIVASIFGFEKKSYFEAEEGAEQAPQVEF